MLDKVAIVSLIVLGAAFYFQSGSKGDIRDGKVIQTNAGEVKGSILVSRDGRDYYAWHRIPYARPPLGDLRFADPLPVDKWTEVIDGREYGTDCSQLDFLNASSTGLIIGAEDCLHVNVFVPKQLHLDIIQGKKPKYPVIVYIHGGGYVMGNSKMGSPDYFMDEDVIYASLNYRLEILGFLTTGDKIARGNQGLKDQTMALKWIKDNVHHFGGDPNQITIIGTSAGGASVHQQTLSPLSKGLFQRAFSQSGAASNTWGLIPLERSVEKGKKFAKSFNCPTQDSQKMVDCLRKLDVETIQKERVSFLEEWILLSPHMYAEGFLPVVEGVKDSHAFITEHPIKTVSEGKAHRVPLLIGHTTHEGLMSAGIFRRDPQALAKFESSLVPALKVAFGIENLNVGEIADKIHKFYLPRDANVDLDEKIRRYVDMLGDGFFNYDIRETVRNQRKFSPVYYYLQNNTNIPYIDWFLPEGTDPPYNGIDHAADCYFFFPVDEIDMRITKGDKLYEYSKDLVNMIVQFAKDDTKMEFRGKKILPTPSEGMLKVTEFKTEEVVVSPEPFTDRMEFLRSLKIRP